MEYTLYFLANSNNKRNRRNSLRSATDTCPDTEQLDEDIVSRAGGVCRNWIERYVLYVHKLWISQRGVAKLAI